MTSSHRAFLTLILGCGALLLVLFLNRPATGPPLLPSELPHLAVEEVPAEPGEDLQSRQEWEREQLVNPATGRIPPDMRRRELAFGAALPRRTSSLPLDRMPRPGADPAKFRGWTSRGPWNVGGRTRALAIDVTDPTYQTLLAGGVTGGLWRSVDDGQSWHQVIGTDHIHQIHCVVQDTRPGHEHVWYAGTGEVEVNYTLTDGRDHRGDGIYKSTDGGLTWSLLPSTTTATPQAQDQPFDYVARIVVDTSNPDQAELYAATAGHIMRSIDGGDSWTSVLGDSLQIARYTEVAIDNQGVVYAALGADGGQPGVFRSVDGVNWVNLNAPILAIDFGRICLGPAPSFEGLVYVLVANQQSYTGGELLRYRYLSGDGTGGGGEWIDLSQSMTVLPGPYGAQEYGPQRGFNMHVTVNPAQQAHVYIGGQHLWRSMQGWLSEYVTMIGGYYANHHVDQHALVFQPGSSVIAYSASDGGVHKCLNINAAEVNWIPLNNGYLTAQFYTVAVDHARPGDSVVVGGTQDNNTVATMTADPSSPWHIIFGGDGGSCTVLNADEQEFVASYFRANTFRVDYDKDASLVLYACLTPATGDGFEFINPALSDPQDIYALYIASDHGVLRNLDIRDIPWGSYTPTTIGWERLTSEPSGDPVTALGANAQPGHALYYGTKYGRLFRVDDALAAPAGSVPVELTGNAPFPEGARFVGIAVHPDDGDRVLVCVSNYEVSSLWSTTDGGATWTDVEGNLAGPDGPAVLSVAGYAGDAGDVWFAGTSVGLYSTLDTAGGPVTWTQEAPDLIGNVKVRALTVRQSDGLVAVASHGRGMFTVELPELSVVGVPAAAAHLAQNVPNPFNPRTRIAFTLPTAGRATVEVYDVRGRLVRTLQDGYLAEGPHGVVWQGDDAAGHAVATGVYLYRLTAPGIVETRSMVLAR